MWAVVIAVIVTAVVMVVSINLNSAEKRLQKRVRHQGGSGGAQFRRSMSMLLGPGILPGNRIETLVNGSEIFPAMLVAIAAARRTITFETFVYWKGEIGAKFAQALAERARAGVRVHVLLDWMGSASMDREYLDQMEKAGCELRKYHPPHWYHLSRLNNRTHRKLLVIDGRVGFTGGVGIADAWDGNAEDPKHWRDTHYRVKGPVVAQMQAVFMDNWIKVTGEALHGRDYFPPLARAGDSAAQMFSSSPAGGSESMHLMYLMLLAAATDTIDMQAAYFVPDRLAVRALLDAVRRGVRVRIIVPGKHTDYHVVRRASQALWGALLNAGVEIYEYLPTMYHCKTLIIDGRITSVGSTNFDPRSFRLNDEANLNIYDEDFAREQAKWFDADLAQSRRITLARWRKRSLRRRILERASLLFRSQL